LITWRWPSSGFGGLSRASDAKVTLKEPAWTT
jgi:hypothetical protein